MSAPGLSRGAMVEITDTSQDLELFQILTCIKRKVQELEFEEGTRGEISDILNRYIKANYKYFKSYDPKRESKHIIYLDKNNLCKCVICVNVCNCNNLCKCVNV